MQTHHIRRDRYRYLTRSYNAQERDQMKKLLVLIGIGILVYLVLKDRFGNEPEEFVFTEAPGSNAVDGHKTVNTPY